MIMKITEKIERQLLDYIDGSLPEKDKAAFEELLATNAELRCLYQDLQNIEATAREQRPESPSRNFTARVMAGLHQSPLRNTPSILNSILLLAGILIVVGLCIALLSSGVFDQSATIRLGEIALLRKYMEIRLPSIGVDGKLLVTSIIFLNLAIALIVLDRSVLKPFFQRRMGGM
jgi:anti-sigma factor RsiW